MNLIEKAINNKWNICDDNELNDQTWENFYAESKGKKLVLYGLGDAMQYFFAKYSEMIEVSCAIDGDINKQGRHISEFCYCDCNCSAVICGEAALNDYDTESTVVLILSLKQYPAIYRRLVNHGYENVFSFVVMECKTSEESWIDVDSLEKEYIANKIRNYPIRNNKIAVHSMGRVADHAKYVIDRCLHTIPNLEVCWLLNELPAEQIDGVTYVLKNNRKAVLDATVDAKLWIDDYLGAFWMEKRPEQIMIELKHWSSITLKSFGFTLERKRNVLSNIQACEDMASKIDYVVIGSDFDERTCKEGFEVEKEYLLLGSSRSDILFGGEQYKKQILSAISTSEEYKYLLYAPTFRTASSVDASGNTVLNSYYSTHGELDYERLGQALEKRFGGKWKILLRLHPVIAKQSKIHKLPDNVIDCSDYPDSQELVLVSDLVITDYSSIVFEPAFVHKPVLLFCTDLEEYLSSERDLLLDYRKLPFMIAANNDELENNVNIFDYEDYEKVLMTFFDEYGVYEDGHASERTALFINDIINGTVKDLTYYENCFR